MGRYGDLDQTVAGSVMVVKMPDGSTELVEQVENNGKKEWIFVKDRIRKQKENEDFDARFAKTETKPDDENKVKTEPITRKKIGKLHEFDPQPNPAEHINSDLGDTTKQLTKTQKHLYAHLIEVLGGHPASILQNGLSQKILDSLKKNPVIVSTVLEIIKAIDHPAWNSVGDLLKEFRNA
jgi:hypothetical protein